MTRPGTLALIVLAVALSLPATASAKLFTVDSAADAAHAGSINDGVCLAVGGGCTLRAAVEEANGTTGPDEIALPARDYVLTTNAFLSITSNLTITGEGARTTTVDAGGDTAVFSITGGSVTLSGMSITGGRGMGVGGVYVQGTGTEATLDHVAVHDNTTSAANPSGGGGIDVFSGSLIVTNSAIYDNKSATTSNDVAEGGGVNLNGGATSGVIENTTIADNRATSDTGSTFGGGISTNGVPLTLRHVTLTGNVATPGGQGGNVYSTAGTDLVIEDSIVAGGSAFSGNNCQTSTGAPVLQGVNLSDDATCGVPAANVGDPKLEPLGDYGGPTGDTRPPMVDSPARDAAASCQAGGRDQRGQAAPLGPACDVGAAELGADQSASLTPSAHSVDAGESLTYVAVIKDNGLDSSDATLTFTPAAGSTVTFVNSLFGACDGTAPVVCSYGKIGPGESRSVTITVTAPPTGPMTATATASGPVPDPDAANSTAGATTDVVPAAAPPPPPDTTAPALSGLKLAGKLSRKKGGKLRYKLSEKASLSIRLDRRGKKKKLVKVGVQKVAGKAGTHTAKLRAKWSGKKAKRGRARLTIVATDAAGNKSAAKQLTVRITR